MLKVQNLGVAFWNKSGWQRVVDNLSFELQKSKCLGIVGESGSGKSMAASAIMQLLPFGARVADDSRVLWQGEDLLTLSEQRMRYFRGKRFGMIFQDAMSAFNPVLTIAEQMNDILSRDKTLSRSDRTDFAIRLLDKVGIKDLKRCYHAYPHQLSGGMRQRAMIAMALCGKPDLIIADEPTTALDVTIQAQILDLLLQLREEEALTLIFITHDLAIISKIADDILVMKKGVTVEMNTTQSFFKNPEHDYSKHLLNSLPSSVPRMKDDGKSKPLLTVTGLKVYYPSQNSMSVFKKDVVKAVDDVSFTLNAGRTLALVGESGSGKSTVAKSILRLIQANSGHAIFQNASLFELSSRKLRRFRRHMQIIFQDPFASLNPRRMVADSIAEGMLAVGVIQRRREALVKVDELLEKVGLSPNNKWRYPHEFSGGEKQRICIARALALRPKLLILDEPTSALDVSIQMQILKLLERLQQEYNIAYLLITHDLSVVSYLSHSIALMYHGQIVEMGETQSVLREPTQAYTRQLLAAMPTAPNFV